MDCNSTLTSLVGSQIVIPTQFCSHPRESGDLVKVGLICEDPDTSIQRALGGHFCGNDENAVRNGRIALAEMKMFGGQYEGYNRQFTSY
jgi:hypothetical protein